MSTSPEDNFDYTILANDEVNLPAARPSMQPAQLYSGTLVPFVDVRADEIDRVVFTLIDIEASRRLRATPVSIDEIGTIVIGLTDPSNLATQDDIRMRLAGRELQFVAIDDKAFDAIIARWGREVARADESDAVRDLANEDRGQTVEEEAEVGPMATLVNKLLEQAVIAGASDVHIEPTDDAVEVRFRIDGVLRYHTSVPINLGPGMVNRIKVMGRMEANHLAPQDGRFNRRLASRDIDCRVVSLPTARGVEGVVIRLLDQSRSRTALEQIGFHTDLLDKFREVLEIPHGMILVTGPTGSGKTTTLYASLGLVARPDRKTVTIEDPVEIRLPSVTQLQVNERQNLTFASALRSFLRADPDVMLVGEIRDSETAALAAQASLTGHLVLSTLHTNEAAGASSRLINLGVESFLIASALKAVLAQRLIRKLCNRCAKLYEPTEAEFVKLNWPEELARPEMLLAANPNGCADCNHVGYKGRIPVAELILVNNEIAHAMIRNATSSEIEAIARTTGSVSLHVDACRFVAEQVTSVEELLRVGV
jgi:type IV pilus assembly protein PilB